MEMEGICGTLEIGKAHVRCCVARKNMLEGSDRGLVRQYKVREGYQGHHLSVSKCRLKSVRKWEESS